MDLGLSGRTCLVTGASIGIGRATAAAFAREGARLAIVARSLDALASTRDDILAAGAPPPLLLAADLSRPGSAGRLADDVLRQAGPVDVLVNNAGGSRPMSRPDEVEVWEESFQLNFTAARQLAEALVPAMVESGFGRIINVTGAILAKRFNAAGPAKAALESWSKAAAGSYAKDGVTVNCIAPGRLNTRQILETLHPTEASRQDYIATNIPAGRFGEPEDAANLIAFLASDKAAYINGTTVPVDGGAMRLAF